MSEKCTKSYISAELKLKMVQFHLGRELLKFNPVFNHKFTYFKISMYKIKAL